jgi:transposase
MKATPIQRMDLHMDELESIVERAKVGPLDEQDCATILAVFQSYLYVTDLLEERGTTLERLRKLVFGSSSEKTRAVLANQSAPSAGTPLSPAVLPEVAPATPDTAPPPAAPTPAPGHGRNGARAYRGAERVQITNRTLKPGYPCPECKNGSVYVLPPGILVRIVGQAPLQAKVYEFQKLRCNLCGKVFTAPAPEGVGSEKYDATAASMISLLKYGTGLPFNRLEGLQDTLGIPLPASTQWDIVSAAAGVVRPAYDELINQAAQGEMLHNDDTTVKILQFMGKRARQQALAEAQEPSSTSSSTQAVENQPVDDTGGAGPPATAGEAVTSSGDESDPTLARTCAKRERRGLFTSGIVSTREDRRIALFFSGRKHAGENLADVLARRAQELGPPIQMCDALSRNLPVEFKTILGNCLAHGRRQFVDVVERFPEECRSVLEQLAEVYKYDALARERNLSPEERLHFHQANSGPVLEQLQAWCRRQLADRLVEPNSALGEAISYLLKHWDKLTLFLRQPGAPLDNNICERALKKAILHRKNALFYKTLNGARVGDIFMSLIYTCQLGEADPFDYLTELQRHAAALATAPQQWMPWNYRVTIANLAADTTP